MDKVDWFFLGVLVGAITATAISWLIVFACNAIGWHNGKDTSDEDVVKGNMGDGYMGDKYACGVTGLPCCGCSPCCEHRRKR